MEPVEKSLSLFAAHVKDNFLILRMLKVEQVLIGIASERVVSLLGEDHASDPDDSEDY